jgi:hypothetical protein
VLAFSERDVNREARELVDRQRVVVPLDAVCLADDARDHDVIRSLRAFLALPDHDLELRRLHVVRVRAQPASDE